MSEIQNSLSGNLADSIAMLEQILEVMPQDADALKALYSAYHKTGRHGQAFEYLNRMVDVYIGGGDRSLDGFILQEMDRYEPHFPSEVAAQKARLRMLDEPSEKGRAASVPAAKPFEAQPAGKKKEAEIGEELALAWRLYEESQLSQEEYSSVLHDLTEVSSKNLDVPVSVLHVLNDRGFTQMNRIMNYLSNRSGVPCIALANFELTDEVAAALPVDFAMHEGALPFGFMGNDLLVAVLNPFNHVLVDKMETEYGQRCHTYLVGPEDYDRALGKLRSLPAGRTNPPAQP